MAWREFAWNGVSFMAPANWQVGRIGARYLMLEKESEPVLEVKWRRVKGTFSHQAQLRRLATLHGKELIESVGECSLPAEWENALGKYKTIGFSWRGKTIGGLGVILYCPRCQNATLIQFYGKGSTQAMKVPQRLLASFRDHRQDHQVIWSLFDIRAMIPEKFKLVRHRFEPGEFELRFASGGHKITLHRWGPASILLGDRDLVHFARTMFPYSQVKHLVTATDGKAVEWSITSPPSFWDRWWGRMRAEPSFQWFRLWHAEEKNRILGVRIEGKGTIDSHFLDRICAGYESL